MINSSNSTLGIIFPNIYDEFLPEMTNIRLMASVPFAARYRLVDFPLSAMSNCGIDNIYIMARKNYHSLVDHLGSGREWDLVRKTGGLHLFPPYATGAYKPGSGRIEVLGSILNTLRNDTEKYVVLTDSNIACNFDYTSMVRAHEKSGADITIAYNVQEIPEDIIKNTANNHNTYYTLKLDGDKVTNIYVNQHDKGQANLSMNIYLMERELLIEKVNAAFVRGMNYLVRDMILPQLDTLDVRAYRFDGYVARICGINSYFEENMKLLKEENLDALFSGNAIYTKIRDDNPTRYVAGAKVSNIMAADGCVIEGEVENSVLFRGVKIAKGAKVSNCILMQDTVVEENVELEYIITDKNVNITAGKVLKGTDTKPFYIAKGSIV